MSVLAMVALIVVVLILALAIIGTVTWQKALYILGVIALAAVILHFTGVL